MGLVSVQRWSCDRCGVSVEVEAEQPRWPEEPPLPDGWGRAGLVVSTGEPEDPAALSRYAVQAVLCGRCVKPLAVAMSPLPEVKVS